MTLSEYFAEHNNVAVALSGGADSAYLLYAALQSGARTAAYFVKTAFQPTSELDDAERLSRELETELRVIELDILFTEEVRQNAADRCYHCKKRIFGAITKAARWEGFELVADGTNADDDERQRPGMKALRELSVVSPLKECGLGKSDIRRLSKEAGLFTHDKPAYACLATRIHTGEEITREKLRAIEGSESFLRSLGFSDFRVRTAGDTARIELRYEQFPLIREKRAEILGELKKSFEHVTLDLEERK